MLAAFVNDHLAGGGPGAAQPPEDKKKKKKKKKEKDRASAYVHWSERPDMAEAAAAFSRAGKRLADLKPSKRLADDTRVVCVKCILHALKLCVPCQGEAGIKIARKYLRHLSTDEALALYPSVESLFEDEGKADAARAERAAKVAAAIRISQFHALDQPVQIFRTVVTVGLQWVGFQQIEHLQNMDAAG